MSELGPAERLLDLDGVCVVLGIGRTTAKKLRRQGELPKPFGRRGGRFVWRERDILLVRGVRDANGDREALATERVIRSMMWG